VTSKLQAARRCLVSVAEQFTVVVPIGKGEPLGTEQLVVTGAAPPVTTGAPYETANGFPSEDVADTGAGHVICGASGVGGVGLPHAPAPSAPAISKP
jgi:hypothetical protein